MVVVIVGKTEPHLEVNAFGLGEGKCSHDIENWSREIFTWLLTVLSILWSRTLKLQLLSGGEPGSTSGFSHNTVTSLELLENGEGKRRNCSEPEGAGRCLQVSEER